MPLQVFSSAFLVHLSNRAKASSRRRQHHNIHTHEDEPVQRFFNAIEIDSYIRPHRHLICLRWELLLGIRGRLALLTFEGGGEIGRIVPIGTNADDAVGVELDPDEWHTIIALEAGSILFEVKQGPYDPDDAKEMAPWSPPEGTCEALHYLRELRARTLALLAVR